MTKFTGYPNGLDLLARIGNASKDEFAELKPRWSSEILEPTKALVEAVGPGLQERISPTVQYAGKVNGSISPIVRDLRFAADKSRQYKVHLLLNFWDGPEKKTAVTLRVRMSADDVGFATGMMLTPETLPRWRERLTGDGGARLVAALDRLESAHETSRSEPELKKPAIDVPEDSPVRELLRHKSFQVRMMARNEPPEQSPALAEWIVDHLATLKETHQCLLALTNP